MQQLLCVPSKLIIVQSFFLIKCAASPKYRIFLLKWHRILSESKQLPLRAVMCGKRVHEPCKYPGNSWLSKILSTQSPSSPVSEIFIMEKKTGDRRIKVWSFFFQNLAWEVASYKCWGLFFCWVWYFNRSAFISQFVPVHFARFSLTVPMWVDRNQVFQHWSVSHSSWTQPSKTMHGVWFHKEMHLI